MDELLEFGTVALATLLGVPAGFALQKWIDRVHGREDKERLLRALEMNLQKNIELLMSIISHTTDPFSGVRIPGTGVYYPLDLASWPSMSTKLGSFENKNFEEVITWIYFELNHLERKLDANLQLAFISTANPKALGSIADAIVTQIWRIFPVMEVVLQEIPEFSTSGKFSVAIE